MLRLLVLLLVLLNAGYWAWSHDLLRAYGFGPQRQGEPQRLQQQIRPQALVIVAVDAQSAGAGAPQAVEAAPASCLQAGLFDPAQADVLRQRLAATVPAGAWSLQEVVVPARWIIYMGRYADAQALAKKSAELTALGVRSEPLSDPALGLGLSLGTFESRELAEAELAELARRGVRTGQVLQQAGESRASMLRITPIDEALRARLDELGPVLAGKTLQPCP